MKAVLMPLEGKYYDTEILLDFEDGYEKQVITLSGNGYYEPSIRELNRHGITQEQWDNNEELDNGWGGKTPIQDMDLFDSHYERKATYERALSLIEKINANQE